MTKCDPAERLVSSALLHMSRNAQNIYDKLKNIFSFMGYVFADSVCIQPVETLSLFLSCSVLLKISYDGGPSKK